MSLAEIISRAADQCEVQNVPNDSEPDGALSRWVQANCTYRPGTLFFIVMELACELADRDARREGFKDQLDRAASRVDWSKSRRKQREAAEIADQESLEIFGE